MANCDYKCQGIEQQQQSQQQPYRIPGDNGPNNEEIMIPSINSVGGNQNKLNNNKRQQETKATTKRHRIRPIKQKSNT